MDISKRTKIISIVFISIIVLISGIFIFLFNTYKKMNYILPNNISINGLNIGGKNVIEAQNAINFIVEEQLNREISIIFKNENDYQEYKFSLDELGFKANTQELEKQIFITVRNDLNLVSRFKRYYNVNFSGMHVSLKYKINKEKFFKTLDIFDASKVPKPVNASFEYKNGKLNIIDEKIGYEFDKERIYNSLKNNYTISQIELYLKESVPKITAEILKQQGIKKKVSSYSTQFSTSNSSRTHNIKLAARNINGTILSPGEVFSFNDIVGKRTKERGFKEAGVYINGKVSDGIGGGICQVSTTLYNAVLLSDLEIVERSNHSLTVPYVPLSRDATVSWGYKDFKFRNDTDSYIYIGSRVNGNEIIFDLFGSKENKKIELISTVISKENAPVIYESDNTLDLNERVVLDKGYDGYISSLTKNVYEDGELVSSEVISTDTYKTSPKIIKKNISGEKANP